MVRSTSPSPSQGSSVRFAAGCGGNSKPNVARPQQVKGNPEQFVMQAGEEPGFNPIESPRVDSGAESLGLTAAGTARLRQSGFLLGNEGEGSFVELLSAGAMAIYVRTNGECPA